MYQRRIIIIIVVILIAALGVYLNRTYARIYRAIAVAGLVSPSNKRIYPLNDNSFSTTIVYDALGDSLTAGVGTDSYDQSFPHLIARNLLMSGKNITLKNLSVPGAKTADLIYNQLPQVIIDQPQVVTVLIGTNDIHGNVSGSVFRKNYKHILQVLTTKTKATVYVISVPRTGTNILLRFPYNYYFDWRTRMFNNIIKELAVTYQVTYLDLYTPTAVKFSAAGSHYSADLFHPSAEGYAQWAQLLYDRIR